MFSFMPNSVLQMCTIFLSIVIEALPFVLLGCLISGTLQVFLTPERVKRWLPANRFLSILTGSVLGFFFPSCECGIVPIVHQFVKKRRACTYSFCIYVNSAYYQSNRDFFYIYCFWEFIENGWLAHARKFCCCINYWYLACLFSKGKYCKRKNTANKC